MGLPGEDGSLIVARWRILLLRDDLLKVHHFHGADGGFPCAFVAEAAHGGVFVAFLCGDDEGLPDSFCAGALIFRGQFKHWVCPGGWPRLAG